LDFSSLLGGATGGAPGTASPLNFGSLMQQLQGMQTNQQQNQQQQQQQNEQQFHPADRYRSQLQSLRDMGFDDEQASLAALQQNHGNLNRAVDQLLMGPSPPAAAAPVAAPAPSNQEVSGPPHEPKEGDDKKND
jgi:membrane protease subunit (stomatin/prohibitin family)